MSTETLNGVESAKRWAREILLAAKATNNSDLAALCRKIDGIGIEDPQESHQTERGQIIEGTPPKNHIYRFSLEEFYSGVKKSTWGFKPSRKSIFGNTSDSQDYEDV